MQALNALEIEQVSGAGALPLSSVLAQTRPATSEAIALELLRDRLNDKGEAAIQAILSNI